MKGKSYFQQDMEFWAASYESAATDWKKKGDELRSWLKENPMNNSNHEEWAKVGHWLEMAENFRQGAIRFREAAQAEANRGTPDRQGFK